MKDQVHEITQEVLSRVVGEANAMEGNTYEREAFMMSVVTSVSISIIGTIVSAHADEEGDDASLIHSLYGAMVRSMAEGISANYGAIGETVWQDRVLS